MLPPPCSQCGAPLPVVATDPQHPDRCPACAARGAGVDGPTPAPPAPQASGRSDQYGADAWVSDPNGLAPAALVVRTRLLDGLLTGAAAAAIAGALWWAAVSLTESQYPYLAVILGVLVGRGVVEGSRKGGVVPGLVAVVLCLVALASAQYFIERSLAIAQAADAGRSVTVPLWQGFGFAKDVVREAIEGDKARLLFWGLGAVGAAVTAGVPSRRAVT